MLKEVEQNLFDLSRRRASERKESVLTAYWKD